MYLIDLLEWASVCGEGGRGEVGRGRGQHGISLLLVGTHSQPVPTRRFVEGYVAAVTAACSIAVALNSLLQRADTWTPRTKMVAQRFIPFPAVGE